MTIIDATRLEYAPGSSPLRRKPRNTSEVVHQPAQLAGESALEDPDASQRPVDFGDALNALYRPALERLDVQLAKFTNLSSTEITLIIDAAGHALGVSLHRKLCRLLVVELNTARTEGRLRGPTPEARWDDFIATSSTLEFWDGAVAKYPNVLARVARIVANAFDSVLSFAQAWTRDRAGLNEICGTEPGRLTSLRFAAGDSHRGGRSVAILSCEAGRLVYKPRSVQPELALKGLLSWLERELGRPLPMRVPRAVSSGDHGWTDFIGHVFAADRQELRSFYQGLGQWLAVMRLLGGTDLHAENLIAHGSHPVIVDCETLFTPKVRPFATGLGEAVDEAMRLVGGTVLATGLLPNRGEGLGWRGVDASGIGALPREQPVISVQDLIDAGTDRARIGLKTIPVASAQNHPTAEPALMEFWPDVLDGFDMLSGELRRLDEAGRLREQLTPFENCEVRVVTRATEIYAELARMLWHPVSLHDEPAARQRARDLLTRMAANVSVAPSKLEVIEAEIADLLVGDVPYFSTRANDGRLKGPGGTTWLETANLVDQAVADWRAADLRLEHDFVRTTLISAYASETRSATRLRIRVDRLRGDDLDRRRREQAAAIMAEFVSTATRGRDGGVTWVASTLTPTGWSLQPIGADLYGGLSGVALVLAAYLREQKEGRADPVAGVDDLLRAVLRSLDLFEDQQVRHRSEGRFVRPPPPGGFLGLGSQIWARLNLERWGHGDDGGVARAIELARGLPASAAADEGLDVLAGRAGAIPALLALAARTGDGAFTALACDLGDQLLARAKHRDGAIFWVDKQWPEGLGGFAHGVSGMGWALARLGVATGQERFTQAARSAFLFEASLFDADEQNWLDLRMLPGTKTSSAWCHGCVGIGLARIDLDPLLADPEARLIVRQAVHATNRFSFGWSHCACHGDVGAWEFLERASAAGEGANGVDREVLLMHVLTSLEDHGLNCGSLRQIFQPGLLAGQGGVLYQLLRAHPDSHLPSFLTLST